VGRVLTDLVLKKRVGTVHSGEGGFYSQLLLKNSKSFTVLYFIFMNRRAGTSADTERGGKHLRVGRTEISYCPHP
jgi:hypothetical protein